MPKLLNDNDNFNISNNSIFEYLDVGTFQSIHYNIVFKYFDIDIDKDVMLGNYIIGLNISNDYSDSYATYIKVDMVIPGDIAARILTLYNNKSQLQFFFKFIQDSPMVGRGIIKSITSKLNIISDAINNSFDNQDNANNFNYKPYDECPFIISDIQYTVPEQSDVINSVIASSADLDVDNLNKNYKLTLVLVNENALNFTKTNISFILNNATIDKALQSMVLYSSIGLSPNTNKMSGNTDNLYKFIQKPHNNNPHTQIVINNLNFSEALNYLEEHHGIYACGTDFFIEGKYLYIGDSQTSNLLNNTDIFIEVIDKQASVSLPDKNGMFYYESPVTDSGSSALENAVSTLGNINKTLMYFTCTYNNVDIYNNEKITRELYGDNVKVRYKTKETELLFPESIKSVNYNNHYNTKYYDKLKDCVFFESKLLSDYSDSLGKITIRLSSINPDLIHKGKHIYIHFNNIFLNSIHNGKYKVINKTINYNYERKRSNIVPTVLLTLVRVLDELPYEYDELTTNNIYKYEQETPNVITQDELLSKYKVNQVAGIIKDIGKPIINLTNSFLLKQFMEKGVTNMNLSQHYKKMLSTVPEKTQMLQLDKKTNKEYPIEIYPMANYKRLMNYMNIIYAYIESVWKYNSGNVTYPIFCYAYNSYRTQKEEEVTAKKYGLKESIKYSSQHIFGEAMDTHFYTDSAFTSRIKDKATHKAIVLDLYEQFGANSKTELNATAKMLIDKYNNGERKLIQQIGHYNWGCHIGIVPERETGYIPGSYVFDGGY